MSDLAPVITLDGPGGAGKGTLAGALSRQLDWQVLDSGALYRAVGWQALQQGWDAQDESAVAQAAAAATTLSIRFQPRTDGLLCVHCEGRDVSNAIRSDAVSAAASRWAALPPIRAALLERQRAFRTMPGLIADGRDMGTVVFPDAPLKFFVTASAMERARRRHAQLQAQNKLSADEDYDSLSRICREIAARDERDASRTASPLKPADDAITIDTTGESVAASLAKVRGFIHDSGLI